MDRYHIVYNPLPLYLMHLVGSCRSMTAMLSEITGLDPFALDESNYLNYLNFKPSLLKRGMVDTLALESKAADYIANQIAKADPASTVVLGDCRRRRIDEIITTKGRKPEAVFITSMSANFPTTALIARVLNHAGIPVIIGGIHVSTSVEDVDVFVRNGSPSPDLISLVRGPGDSDVIAQILSDINEKDLKPEYTGNHMVEDGMWGAENIERMRPMELIFLEKIPLIGGFVKKLIRINPITPYLGCPFSCHFCSISSLPAKQRTFATRSPEDFIAEIKHMQKNGVNYHNRIFFFLPDNLLLGRERLEALLDAIITSDIKINYAAQISIDVAQNPELLRKLRLSGAIHFFIGFESLNRDNLLSIGKSIVPAIDKSGQTVKDYYSKMIRIIQDHGISIHGAFIFGLPNDGFYTLDLHTGRTIADFCMDHHIGIQGCPLTDLPGSRNFKLAQQKKTYVYGEQGTLEYFLALCAADLSECNRIPPKSLKHSMLLVIHLTYDAIRRVGSLWNVIKNALFVFRCAWSYPTKNGRLSILDRLNEAFISASAQLIVNNLHHADETVYSRALIKGSYERYFAMETDEEIRAMFKKHVRKFSSDDPAGSQTFEKFDKRVLPWAGCSPVSRDRSDEA
ncbi:MAG: radical SAM protein [Desulfobacteraceae bacterium]